MSKSEQLTRLRAVMGWGMALNIIGADQEGFQSSRISEVRNRKMDINGQRNAW